MCSQLTIPSGTTRSLPGPRPIENGRLLIDTERGVTPSPSTTSSNVAVIASDSTREGGGWGRRYSCPDRYPPRPETPRPRVSLPAERTTEAICRVQTLVRRLVDGGLERVGRPVV